VPLGADYSRHSRTVRSSFAGGLVGFGLTQVMCLVMGVLALSQVGNDPDRIFDLFHGLPLGAAAFGVLVLRETDQSFANVYSTAVSIQNLAPTWDRRILSTGIGVAATAAALTIDIGQYTNFLYLIGGVFIPLAGALVAAWWRAGGLRWDTTTGAPSRPGMLLAWGVGFVAYQLVNPGAIPGWSGFWANAGRALHTAGHPWLSASLTAFVVAALVAVAATLVERRVTASRGRGSGGPGRAPGRP
jgi:purine-cytosine permease-like protein